MQFEIGQKILIEGTVGSTFTDGDSAVKVDVGDASLVSVPVVSVPVEISEDISIDFSDIQVGDVVRAKSPKTNHGGATSQTTHDNIVVMGRTGSSIGGDEILLSDYLNYTYELVDRPKVKKVKVGDAIDLEAVKTLQVGCVLDTLGVLSMVTLGGLYAPLVGSEIAWDTLDADEVFTVLYMPEVSN